MIKCDPPVEGWARLRRYASWMGGLRLRPEEKLTSDVFFRLSRSSAGGVLFPKLEWLEWDISDVVIGSSYFHLLLPPQLKNITIHIFHCRPTIPVSALVQIISFFTSLLENLAFRCGHRREAPLEDAISSFICRHGSSLRRLDSDIPLSEAAIHHLMQLPNLRSWVAFHEPPRTLPPVTFPSLEKLCLDQVALPWLYRLASHHNTLAPVTSHTNIKETLSTSTVPGAPSSIKPSYPP